MRIITVVELTKEEVQEQLPYQLVTDTFAKHVSRHENTKTLYDNMFNEHEQHIIKNIRQQAKRWAQKGIPDTITMPMETYRLWSKLTTYCEKTND